MGTKSTGCATCKGRKVKCGEEKPFCARCLKAGIKCAGYEGVMVRFKFWGERKMRRDEEHESIQKEREGEKGAVQRYDPKIPTKTATTAVPKTFGWKQSLEMEMEGSQRIGDEVLLRFLAGKLSDGRRGRELVPLVVSSNDRDDLDVDTAHYSWIANLPGHGKTALAAMFFGCTYNVKEMQVSALHEYSRALEEMRRALVANQSRMSIETVGIEEMITMLCMFEISKAIVCQTRTCLGERAWKTGLVREENEKCTFDVLLDILADIANYRADIKELSHHLNANPNINQTNNEEKENHYRKGEELTVQAVASLHELNTWWRDWLTATPNPCTEIHASKDGSNTVIRDTDGPLFPTILRYKDLWTAYTWRCEGASEGDSEVDGFL
ncbi:hypothetical protein G7Y89_g12660 [Cudoniella acicularis]|uniref:Zn(2)-C6 fungal-type domain-containing protein n=1 Tax=Cudoniella acicularis TaxID=354080 RepID=A0A8H4RB36_9HELO|nr:hypothetical protein G7Y89_g12660 [Cudoniella acicularis]